jgi:hypothetical protein
MYYYNKPVTVALRSEVWVLAGWLLGSWVQILLKAWMFVRVFLCCVVVCRQRPCDGLITRPRSPTICLNRSRNFLYVRRPGSFKDCRATKKITIFIISYKNNKNENCKCSHTCITGNIPTHLYKGLKTSNVNRNVSLCTELSVLTDLM